MRFNLIQSCRTRLTIRVGDGGHDSVDNDEDDNDNDHDDDGDGDVGCWFTKITTTSNIEGTRSRRLSWAQFL